MRPIGFSSGAVALGDFARALQVLDGMDVQALELSALRMRELNPILQALPRLELERYRFVSVHAPSGFEQEEEPDVIRHLATIGQALPVVVHPDAIHYAERWQALGERLLLENMDRRKAVGRTARELAMFFEELPQAGLCFDIGHARQVDSSLTEAVRILDQLGDRLREVHVSSVGSDSRHYPLDLPTIWACHELNHRIPEQVPIIIEGRLEEARLADELDKVRQALTTAHVLADAP